MVIYVTGRYVGKTQKKRLSCEIKKIDVLHIKKQKQLTKGVFLW